MDRQPSFIKRKIDETIYFLIASKGNQKENRESIAQFTMRLALILTPNQSLCVHLSATAICCLAQATIAAVANLFPTWLI